MERYCGVSLQTGRVRAEGRDDPDEMQLLGQQHQAAILGAVAETLGHQLRELLTIIDGHLSLAADDLPPEHLAHDNLVRARAAAGLVGTIVSPIFSFLCVREPRPAPLNVGRHLEARGELLERLLLRGQRLAVVLTPDLWPAHVDPALFEQVLASVVVGLSRELPEAAAIVVCGRNVTLEERGAAGVPGGEYVRVSVEGAGHGADAFREGPHALSLAACQSLLAQQGGALTREVASDGAVSLRLHLPRSVAG